MAVTVQIPSILRSCCGGAAEISVAAHTVRGVLDEISKLHPSLYQSICDETGAVRQHVNLFVNSSLLRGEHGLDRTLTARDVVAVFQAVSGG